MNRAEELRARLTRTPEPLREDLTPEQRAIAEAVARQQAEIMRARGDA